MTARRPLSMGISPRLLTRGQAAAYCGLEERDFFKAIKNGILPRRLEAADYWDKKEIDQFIDRASNPAMQHEDRIDGFIYFVRSDDYIKIGYTQNWTRRQRELARNAPTGIDLLFLMGGSKIEEAHLHSQFHEHRQNGEWFKAHPGLLMFIAGLVGAI